MLASIDGQIASFPNQSDAMRRQLAFYHQRDRQLLEEEIAASDLIIVGSHTARAEGGIIDLSPRSNPLWAVISSRPFDEKDSLRVPKKIFCGPDVVQQIFSFARQQSFKKLLLLGGSQINRLFYETRAVQELKITLAPLICASSDGLSFVSSLKEPVNLKLKHVEQQDSHLFLHYSILEF